jgi:hypothetical protein
MSNQEDDNIKKLRSLLPDDRTKSQGLQDFSELLDSIDDLADKKKHLWKQIYNNAVSDREAAGVLFLDLFVTTSSNAAQHSLNGPVLAKYLERMCRSNDQLIKLAELVERADQGSAKIDVEDMYSKIEG